MALNDELLNSGVVMRIHDGNITNETSDSSCEEVHHVLDVTFIDDECIMLATDDSRSLADAIHCCTLVFVDDIPPSQTGGQLSPWEERSAWFK